MFGVSLVLASEGTRWQNNLVRGKIGQGMPRIRIWVYDGILASGVAGTVDVFTAANAVWARANAGRAGKAPLLQWQIESLDGKTVQTASGQDVRVDGAINPRAVADAIVVPGPFVANIERFLDQPETL